MGSRYLEEEPFSFYDQEQDWEGLRAGPPHHRLAPVSPRGPISPRALPLGPYPPELDHGFYNRSGMPGSPHEQPFGPYDLEEDLRERPRHGMGAPFRPLEVEPRYYNPGPQSPKELDSRSRGIGRGVAPPPLYINPNANHLSIPQGSPPSGKYGLQTPLNDSYRRGAPPNDNYARRAPPNDSYRQGAPLSGSYERGAPPSDNYARRAPPNDSYGRGAPPNANYGRGAPPSANYGRGTPPNDSYGRGAPPSDNYARGTPPNDSYGRGAPPNDNYGRGAPPNDSYGQGNPSGDSYGRGTLPNDSYRRGTPGTPPNDSYGRGTLPSDIYARGAPPNESYEQGTSPHGSYGRGAPPNIKYRHEVSPNDIYEQGVPPSDTYGRGSLETSYAGRGVSGRTPPGTPGNNYGAPASGTMLRYGEESFGYGRGLGRGQGVAPLGDGRYEYGGSHQPERLDRAEDFSEGASQPAPISSEYAHQVYASVFSDPVYGGARQLNSQAGYHEEPETLKEAHHQEGVRRHPVDF